MNAASLENRFCKPDCQPTPFELGTQAGAKEVRNDEKSTKKADLAISLHLLIIQLLFIQSLLRTQGGVGGVQLHDAAFGHIAQAPYTFTDELRV